MLELSKNKKLEQPYVVSSNRIYAIGAQNGSFPPMGTHVPGEMGGVIAQPVKILDGYQAVLLLENRRFPLTEAKSFTMKENRAEFLYEVRGIRIRRYEQCYRGERIMELAFRVEAEQEVSLEVEFAIHIRGCWTAEYLEKDCETSQLEWADGRGCIFRNTQEPWYAGVCSAQAACVLPKEEGGRVVNPVRFTAEHVQKQDEVVFHILSGSRDAQEIKDLFGLAGKKRKEWKDENRKRMEALLSLSKVATAQEGFDRAFAFLKINYDMLVQRIEGIGEGYTAGFPEYPWFFGCDTFYGLNGTLAVGQHEMSIQSMRLLHEISQKNNRNTGRIIHELSPFNIVYHYGNTQETPHFVTAVWETFLWTGSRSFLEEVYSFCQKGMRWLRKEKIEELTKLPLGYGITEVEGLNTRVIDSAVLTYSAYKAMGEMGKVFGEESEAENYRQWAAELKESIVTHFFMEESSMFADALYTKEELKERKEDIIYSGKNTSSQTGYLEEYLNRLLASKQEGLIPVMLKNSIVLTPLLEDILPRERGKKVLETILKDSFLNEWGLRLSGLPVKEGDRCGDVYAMNKAMSMGTGKLIKILARYGMPDKAWEVMMRMVNTLGDGMPGSISEVLPDEGCFMQFWSGYGVHYAFISEILGITVNAFQKTIHIRPALPRALDFVKLEKLRVGMAYFTFLFTRQGEETLVEILQGSPEYRITVEAPGREAPKAAAVDLPQSGACRWRE